MKNTVPHSECAMHMKIAGKEIVAVRKRFGEHFTADVWIKGQDPYQSVPYTALISELVPFELRECMPDYGQILVLDTAWKNS